MQTFVRMSKLSDIVGRADYISNPARQEHIVADWNWTDWRPYQEFERTHRRSNKANNEGRELIIALPNEWAELHPNQLSDRMNFLAHRLLGGYKFEFQWAVHWNKAHTNLHVHLIFSERPRQTSEAGVWDRDIYLTQDGKIARRKADRAVDRNGKVKPPVHRKGEPKDGGKPMFAPKDPIFKTRAWLEQTKALVAEFYRKYGITITEQGLMHQFHEGKGKEAPVIRKKNKRIQKMNEFFKPFQELGFVFPKSPSPEYHSMVRFLFNTKDVANPLDLARAIALEHPEMATLHFSADIVKPLHAKIHAAGMKVLASRRRGAQQFSALVALDQADTLQQFIDELTPKPPAPASTPPPPSETVKPSPPPVEKPIDTAHLIELRDNYFRKVLVLEYLRRHHISTSAQEAYDAAQEARQEFDAIADEARILRRDMKAVFNPIKKHKLRSQLYEVAERLETAARKLCSKLNISMLDDGQELEGATAIFDEMVRISYRADSPLQKKWEAAEKESRDNAMTKKLSAENATKESVREALAAFEDACKAVPEGQKDAAIRALCGTELPSPYDFERFPYVSVSSAYSRERYEAREQISRIVSAIRPVKPVVPPSSHESKPEQAALSRQIDEEDRPRRLRR